MRIWLVHGFNVSDGGEGSIGRLLPYLPRPTVLYSYGWTGPFGFGKSNREAVEELRERIKPGDVVIGHSNGALICWELARVCDLGAVVVINPALRRDSLWPPDLPVLCLANTTDWIVSLGRIWGRIRDNNDGVRLTGWGAAGRYGFTASQPNVHTFFTDNQFWGWPVHGHSGVFTKPGYWGENIARWIKGTVGKRAS